MNIIYLFTVGSCRGLVEKPEGNRQLGRTRRRWEDNIKMDLQEVECRYTDWIGLAKDRDSWRALVNAVMNIWFPQNSVNFLTSWEPVSFSRTVLHGVSKVLLDPGLSQLIPVHVLNTLCLNIIVGNVKHRVTTARWTTKESQFLCWYGQGVFLVFTALTQARPNEPPIQYAACAFFSRGKAAESWICSPPTNAEIKYVRICNTTSYSFVVCKWTSWNINLATKANLTYVIQTILTGKVVKCTLVHALRFSTGRTAHRGSRGIAVLFFDHGTRRGWGVGVTPRPLFTPGEEPVPIVQEAGWAPGPFWTGAENLAPHRDSIPRPSSP